MIVDSVKNLSFYENVHPRFARAFAFFNKLMAEGAADGKHVMPDCESDNEIFVNIMSITAQPADGAVCESHKNYIDVQVVLEGDNLMCVPADGFVPEATMPYNEAKDAALYAPVPLKECYQLPVKAGNFAIFFANELHAPGMSFGDTPTPVRKAVIKVLA